MHSLTLQNQDKYRMVIIIAEKKQLVTVMVLYYRPSYIHLLQEFIWQTEDITPPLPRVRKFLHYWKDNIHATIAEVNISEAGGNFRPVALEKLFGQSF